MKSISTSLSTIMVRSAFVASLEFVGRRLIGWTWINDCGINHEGVNEMKPCPVCEGYGGWHAENIPVRNVEMGSICHTNPCTEVNFICPLCGGRKSVPASFGKIEEEPSPS